MNRREIHQLVRRGFSQSPDRRSRIRINLFTGGSYVPGVDSEMKQVILAVRLIEATIKLATSAIPNAPRFPWGYREREALKGTGPLNHVVALFARSLEAQNYRTDSHPTFQDYIAGVFAHPQLSQLLQDMYPGFVLGVAPKPLTGLDGSGYYAFSPNGPCRPQNSQRTRLH